MVSAVARPLAKQVNQALDAVVPVVVDALVARVDLNDLIAKNVDIDALAARLDLDAVVYRLDLIALANYIIDGVDLPAVIRQSSASFSTEAVRGVRMQAADADQAVARLVDRLLSRRHDRHIAPSTNGDGPG